MKKLKEIWMDTRYPLYYAIVFLIVAEVFSLVSDFPLTSTAGLVFISTLSLVCCLVGVYMVLKFILWFVRALIK